MKLSLVLIVALAAVATARSKFHQHDIGLFRNLRNGIKDFGAFVEKDSVKTFDVKIKSPGQVWKDLGDDFEEFGALIPFEEINLVVTEYFFEDKEFQEFLLYLLSDNTKELIKELEAIQEVREFIAYLQDAGVDIHGALNTIHEIFDIEGYKPFSNVRATHGLAQFFKDVDSLIPYKKIEELYHDKMETSQYFYDFVQYFNSQIEGGVLKKISKNERYKEFEQYLQDRNVQVIDISHTIAGTVVNFDSLLKNLGDDLNDFRNLIPLAEIRKVVFEYFSGDAEFQEFVEYILSDNTKELVREVEAIGEVKEVIAYLHNAGVKIHETLNRIHEFLEIEAYRPFSSLRRSGGLAGFVKDIRALIPFEDIKDLYHHKINSSQAFRDFVQFVNSPTAHAAFKKVKENQRVQDFVQYLKDRNVYWGTVLEALHQIVGVPVNFNPLLKSLTGSPLD